MRTSCQISAKRRSEELSKATFSKYSITLENVNMDEERLRTPSKTWRYCGALVRVQRFDTGGGTGTSQNTAGNHACQATAAATLHGGRLETFAEIVKRKEYDITAESVAVASPSHYLEHVRKSDQKEINGKAEVQDKEAVDVDHEIVKNLRS